MPWLAVRPPQATSASSRAGCTTQTIQAGQYLPGTTGNNLTGTGCTEASLNALLGTDVLIPVWDVNVGTGSNGSYHITTYALFRLTGWNTNGGSNHGGTLNAMCDSSGDGGTDEHVNKPCVRGFFKGFTTQTRPPPAVRRAWPATSSPASSTSRQYKRST